MDAHGHLELNWSGETLYVRAVGPFNDEGAEAAVEAYVKILREKPSSAFSVIEILNPEAVGGPNTMDEVTKTWALLQQEGCKALALVYSNAIQRRLAEQHLPAFGKTFSSVVDAELWILERSD